MKPLSWLVIAVGAFVVCVSVGADLPDKFTPPLSEESDQVKRLIARADSALSSDKSTDDILADSDFLPAHEWPRFRALIRRHAGSHRLVMVCPSEPGDPLLVSGTVLDQNGRARAGALLYAYQTSAKGWYSDRATHIAGQEGDRKHARIFGYLRTDRNGRFELRTIRPAGYPGSNLPAHIHIEVERGDDEAAGLVTEIQFDDDPRLTPAMRNRSMQEGFVIAALRCEVHQPKRVDVKLRTR
jgi:protocatechuate 3,4-dioxygenase beta subunit